MGRPSLVGERRTEILDAFERCLVRDGLERTTLDAVAAEAGVQRAAIRHYIGNRDAVVRAGVEHLTAKYREAFRTEVVDAGRSPQLGAVLDWLFLGGFASDHPHEDRAVAGLLAMASSDDAAKTCLREMYTFFEAELCRQIHLEYPDADPNDTVRLAYALMCLAEANNDMLFLGFPSARAHGARAAAQALVHGLP